MFGKVGLAIDYMYVFWAQYLIYFYHHVWYVM